ncbi:gamma-glutamylcyclotransferase family protein [Hahella sp. HN01]|uniref:gamma-glutamylcyclotransferase family protein n=1 Tax=Hahella sp. HN01 TaxID=2847262 RepID=UPI001C1EA7E1|nr:gamma-glutamylcyclotransferase family protein [Hahella sp. HN01]MBU6954698.1 gamma-glutamylcyclotransferase [Hahella sp. HN01]
MSTPLFCYGTLRHPHVMQRLLGWAPEASAARLPGYRCLQVVGKAYPGLWRDRSAICPGHLYHGLTKHDIARLDHYEGDDYERRYAIVRTPGGGRLTAWIYLYRRPEKLTTRIWRYETFLRESLVNYLSEL